MHPWDAADRAGLFIVLYGETESWTEPQGWIQAHSPLLGHLYNKNKIKKESCMFGDQFQEKEFFFCILREWGWDWIVGFSKFHFSYTNSFLCFFSSPD